VSFISIYYFSVFYHTHREIEPIFANPHFLPPLDTSLKGKDIEKTEKNGTNWQGFGDSIKKENFFIIPP